MLTNWIYKPVFEGGFTRPYERFNIFHRTPDNYDNGYGVNAGGHLKHVATVRALPNKKQTEDAARLIAAAPELLAALEHLLAEHLLFVNSCYPGGDHTQDTPEDFPEVTAARAAIAKATGV